MIFLFYCVFYFLEDNGYFNVNDFIYFFFLYYVFMFRINFVLNEFKVILNLRFVCIENNWILVRMWVNGFVVCYNVDIIMVEIEVEL